jgi:hypothetical protein
MPGFMESYLRFFALFAAVLSMAMTIPSRAL